MAKNLQKNLVMSQHYILLLDTFKSLLATYRLILEGEKYLVETTTNVDEAFRLFSLRHYSVFITEYIPPLEETCSMIQRLKNISPETYILMVTNADIDETTYEALFDIGLDDFILKPYAPEKILVHVKKGVRQHDFTLKFHEIEGKSLLDRVTQHIRQPIFNPPYFRKCFRQELKRAKRHKHPLSLLLIPVPSEEELGDQLEGFCTELARVIRSYTREEDMVGREDGQFGILLPDTDQPGSQAVAKRLSHLLQNHPFFQSEVVLKTSLENLSFQSFTYPEMSLLPETLMSVMEQVDNERPRN